VPQALAEQGWYCCDAFIDATLVRELQHEAATRFAHGELKAGAVGAGVGRARRPDVRGDEISWLMEDGSPVTGAIDERFEALRLAINRELMLGLFEHEAHFARYAPGTFYTRHVDTFADRSSRVVSTVLYLNEHWREEEGGALRLYLDDAPARHLDFLPRAGRLITFMSARFPHEVLPARRERWSLTGWYRTRELT